MEAKDTPAVKTRSGLIAALDIGTTKVCCLIARPDARDGLRVVGIGHRVSRGLRAGTIINMDAAEASIRAAVEAAEQMAGENIKSVYVNLSGGTPNSRMVSYAVSTSGHEIGDSDLRRVLDPAVLAAENPEEHEIVHTLPVGYSVDGQRGVRDPRGMYADKLGVNMHIVTAQASALRTLETCISRCHLEVENKVVSAYASGLSCLSDDEMSLGVTCIDMGGGTTSLSVFFDGELIHTDVIPVGGLNVTNDIARGLHTPISAAEHMKTLYGSAIASPSDDHEIIKVPQIGEDESGDANQVPRSMLVGIIRPRLEEIFELVQSRLKSAGFDQVAGQSVVLVGGASQLPGTRELGSAILDRQVRTGRPRAVEGLAEAVSGPAFATCAGLLGFASGQEASRAARIYRPPEQPRGRLARWIQWFGENF